MGGSYPVRIYCHGIENLYTLLEICLLAPERGDTPLRIVQCEQSLYDLMKCFRVPFQPFFATMKLLY